MEDLAQLISDLVKYSGQALDYAAELLDDLAQAQAYVARLGDTYSFIRDTVQIAAADLPRLHEAFLRAW